VKQFVLGASINQRMVWRRGDGHALHPTPEVAAHRRTRKPV